MARWLHELTPTFASSPAPPPPPTRAHSPPSTPHPIATSTSPLLTHLTAMKAISVLIGILALVQAALPTHGEQQTTAAVSAACVNQVGPKRMLRGAVAAAGEVTPTAAAAANPVVDGEESHKRKHVKVLVKKIAIPIPVPFDVPQYIPVPVSQPSTVIASDTGTSTVVASGNAAAAVAPGAAVPGVTPAATRPDGGPQVTPAPSVPRAMATPAPTTISEPPAAQATQPEPTSGAAAGADIGDQAQQLPQGLANGGGNPGFGNGGGMEQAGGNFEHSGIFRAMGGAMMVDGRNGGRPFGWFGGAGGRRRHAYWNEAPQYRWQRSYRRSHEL